MFTDKYCSKLNAFIGSFLKSTWLVMLFLLLNLNGASFAQNEDQAEGMATQGQQQNTGAAQKDENSGTVYNLYGREMGKVSTDGKITNAYGSSLGSVDKNGTVYNVSNIVIGKASESGMISNQAGTVLGYANQKGEIFNNNGNKLGEVKGETDVYKIGAVGRVIFFNK